MNSSRKFSKGDSVKFRGKKWTICKGGRTNRNTKSYEYKIYRGSWKEHVAGNRLTAFTD